MALLVSAHGDSEARSWTQLWREFDACERALLAIAADRPAPERAGIVRAILCVGGNSPAEVLGRDFAAASGVRLGEGTPASPWSTFHPADGLEWLSGAFLELLDLIRDPQIAPWVTASVEEDALDALPHAGADVQGGRREALLAISGIADLTGTEAAPATKGPDLTPIDYALYSVKSRLYDRLYQHEGLYAAHADALIAALGRTPERVLDLCCGTGLLCEELGRRGIDAIGVDVSPDMIRVAADRGANARFVEADACEVELDGAFDIVSCMFGAVHLLSSASKISAMFRNARNHLADDGVLVVDVNDRSSTLPAQIDVGHLPGIDAFKGWAMGRGHLGADQYLLAARERATSEGFIEVQDYRYCTALRLERLALASGFADAHLASGDDLMAVHHAARGTDQVTLVCRP